MVAVWMVASIAWGDSSPRSVAFFYGTHPPVNELKAFDAVVIDPDSGLTPSTYGNGPSRLFAYVSVGEVASGRSYAKQMKPDWLIGENKAWKSRVVDVSSPAWRDFFLDKVIEPLWQAGYRGFFLDTLDSYQLAAKKEDVPRMEAGLVSVIRAIRQRHPEARLIFNRGFEIFERVKDTAFAVVAESLFQNFNPSTGKYGEVPLSDREWLLSKLNEVKNAGVPVIAIDYVPPGKRDLARQTAEKIKTLGFIPWVADKDLASLGVGAVEVLPRRILGIYDGNEADDPVETELHRLAVMPLNYLGYQVDLHDVRETLPTEILGGRYAGVVIWLFTGSSGDKNGLKKWVLRCISEGVPIVFLDRFGVSLDGELLHALGLELQSVQQVVPPLKVAAKDERIGFEQQPLPQIDNFVPLRLTAGNSLLKIVSGNGIASDAIAITSWGGYALQPYVVSSLSEEEALWVVDPFRFFKDALRLPEMPVPDTTTENGVRLLLSHIDGDGFESMAEWPGGRLAAVELREKILKKYRVPTAVSIITGITASNGLYPKKSSEFERAARSIFALPWVEAASHSFSHPFYWQKILAGQEGTDYNLKIAGYRFSMRDEIEGSINYINRLLPPGKRTMLFLWTGDCTPGAEAIEETYRAGIGNLNSGDTLITESNRTVTSVAPLGVEKNGWFQIFAPNQNENVYTNEWKGPFYGFRRVIETFRLTDLPRRLKPVNIYYHFYSATKEASLNALRSVYDWAEKQRLYSIFASEYVEKVLDFNRTVIARDGSGWLVRNSGKLRELRIYRNMGYPDLIAGSNVAGFNDHGDSRYIHLLPGGEAHVRLKPATPRSPYLISAGGYLESMERKGHGVKLSFKSFTPFTVRLGNTSGCRYAKGTNAVRTSAANEFAVDLGEGNHAVAIDCR